jgi:hypothetical protein
VFLLLATRDAMRNLSLFWFTIWSSVVQAGIMAVHIALVTRVRQ